MPQWNLTTAKGEEKEQQQKQQEMQAKGERNKVKETGIKLCIFVSDWLQLIHKNCKLKKIR